MPNYDDMAALRAAQERMRNKEISDAVLKAKKKVIHYIKQKQITREEGNIALQMYRIYFREGHEESIEEILVNNRKRNNDLKSP